MAKQTGPKTAEGKAKSSQNATKHGLTSNRMFVLDNETPEKWDYFEKVWTDKLQPRDEAEAMIVTDIAHAQWRLRRAFTIETGMIDLEMDMQVDYMNRTFIAPIDEGTRMACAFKALGDESRGLDHIHRYETRARRAYRAGINALEQLRRICPAPADTATAPAPPPDTRATSQSPAAGPQPVPKKTPQRPAAQQFTPDLKKLQNEITPRCRQHIPAARRAAIQRINDAFGGRIPIRITPPTRRRRA